MFHYEGIGLSANQIGIWERAFCMMIDIKTEEVITCFNPRIIKTMITDNWWKTTGAIGLLLVIPKIYWIPNKFAEKPPWSSFIVSILTKRFARIAGNK